MRHPKASAISTLAKRFGLPNHPMMQDWEYEVSDEHRIAEFLAAYLESSTCDDERFILMEMLLQSFTSSNRDLKQDQDWKIVLECLENRLALYATNICYWACKHYHPHLCWKITPYIRKIRHRHHLKIID